jgi:hypothetical protein
MHPLAPNLRELRDTELQEKLRDLENKLAASYRMGHGELIHQISLMLEDYRTEAARRQQIAYEEMMSKSRTNFDDIIKTK